MFIASQVLVVLGFLIGFIQPKNRFLKFIFTTLSTAMIGAHFYLLDAKIGTIEYVLILAFSIISLVNEKENIAVSAILSFIQTGVFIGAIVMHWEGWHILYIAMLAVEGFLLIFNLIYCAVSNKASMKFLTLAPIFTGLMASGVRIAYTYMISSWAGMGVNIITALMAIFSLIMLVISFRNLPDGGFEGDSNSENSDPADDFDFEELDKYLYIKKELKKQGEDGSDEEYENYVREKFAEIYGEGNYIDPFQEDSETQNEESFESNVIEDSEEFPDEQSYVEARMKEIYGDEIEDSEDDEDDEIDEEDGEFDDDESEDFENAKDELDFMLKYKKKLLKEYIKQNGKGTESDFEEIYENRKDELLREIEENDSDN